MYEVATFWKNFRSGYLETILEMENHIMLVIYIYHEYLLVMWSIRIFCIL